MNCCNDFGQTPLMLALENDWELQKKAELRLEAGADVNMTDDTDLRAINYARENPKLKDMDILQTIEHASLN